MTDTNDISAAEQLGDDRGISVGRDASGNAFVTGDNNDVKIFIYQTISQQRQPEESRSTVVGPNPYMGLLAFHEEDADRFFGREKQITRLWEKLRDLQQDSAQRSATPRLLPILGPSGSGKSSVARAGLIPELARRPLPGWRDARVAVFTPGSHPVEALAGVLARIATGDAVPVAKTREFKEELKLRSDAGHYDGLRRIADALPEIASMPLIILVDQFEEIYSLCDDKQERTLFIENLLFAASDVGGRATIVITLRTDFLGETQTHEVLNRLICEQQVMIPALNEEELRAVIAKPAALARHPLDDATITLLVNDAKGREGALPLLQFALTRIWDGLTRGIEPAETYQKIGGVGGALAGEAQRIYEGLADDQQRIAKRVFLGLVQLGEGTRDTRRRAVISELVSVGEDPVKVDQVIRRFSGRDSRLVTLSSDERGTADTAEVTHEALFTHWKQLNEWLDENRKDIRFSRRLAEAARYWDHQGRPDGGLWRPPNLELLRQFHGRMASDMNSLQMDFYVASDRGEKERVAKELRHQFLLRSLLAVAASASLLCIAMLVWALFSRSAAIRMEQNAQEGRIDALIDSIFLAPPKTAGDRIASLTHVATSPSLRKHAVEKLNSTFKTKSPEEQDALTSGRASLSVALVRMGESEQLWPLLKHSQNPTLRSYLIHRYGQAGADIERIVSQLEKEQETSIRRALILTLGEFDETGFPSDNRKTLIPKLVDFYRGDPDSGIHAASEWLLRRWKQESLLTTIVGELKETDPQLQDRKAEDKRNWYINSQGQTMVIIDGPVKFSMGSLEGEPGRSNNETHRETIIDHRFAIAAHEVSVGQFRAYRKDHKCSILFATDNDYPVNSVSWYDAAAYCNWLSEQEGIDKSQWCYRPNAEDEFAEGTTVANDYLKLLGYRLPTEAEWEYACRARSETAYSFGDTETMLANYACCVKNSFGTMFRVGSLKPNDFGLFDIHGNAFEWCQDEYDSEYTTAVVAEDLTVNNTNFRVSRGGSFYFNADFVRSAFRNYSHPNNNIDDVGFRVARTYK